MAKNEKTNIAVAKNTQVKKRKIPNSSAASEKCEYQGGIDDFDLLFSQKRRQDKKIKEEEEKREANKKAAKKARFKGAICTKKNRMTDTSGSKWVDDGLGGKYNKEGYTGRIEDGMKIFKRHILNKPGAGSTKDCPFDCNCCFI